MDIPFGSWILAGGTCKLSHICIICDFIRSRTRTISTHTYDMLSIYSFMCACVLRIATERHPTEWKLMWIYGNRPLGMTFLYILFVYSISYSIFVEGHIVWFESFLILFFSCNIWARPGPLRTKCFWKIRLNYYSSFWSLSVDGVYAYPFIMNENGSWRHGSCCGWMKWRMFVWFDIDPTWIKWTFVTYDLNARRTLQLVVNSFCSAPLCVDSI